MRGVMRARWNLSQCTEEVVAMVDYLDDGEIAKTFRHLFLVAMLFFLTT